jgi:hypothetical protein
MKITFVHLGKNPSPTLFKAAEVAQHSAPRAEVCLISDQQNLLREFPGTSYQYSSEIVEPYLASFVKKNKELKSLSGGYWLNTIARLFALAQVARVAPNESMIHLESDVYLYASDDDLSRFSFSQETVSYPRLSRTRGIASFLFIPNLVALESFLLSLKTILSQNTAVINDMDLLGHALNLGIATELPSVPTFAEERLKCNFIFDGAALGQYLLGVDPVHTSGSVVSGFQNSDYPIEISKLRWSIPKPGSICMSYHNVEHKLVTLHAHSKELLEPPDPSSTRWRQIINEANLDLPREVRIRDFVDVYHDVPPFFDRVRVARKNGFSIYLRKYLKRRMKSIMKGGQ